MSKTPEIYDGKPVFTVTVDPETGQEYCEATAFHFYDSDKEFQKDAPKAARFIGTRLGFPLMDVELTSGSMFTALEEAVTTYGNTIYAWKVRENYLNLEGGSNQIPANDMVVEPTLQRIVEIAKNYGTEADVGGNVTLHHDMLELKAGVQDYDLNLWAKNLGIEGGIEIRRVFYEAPPAILRYFDPYAGTGTGIQSLMDAFDFGSYSPGVNFLLMPISYDLLKIQAIEFNDQVRKSTYSFRLSNNQLSIFPIPSQGGFLRIEYYKLSDKRKLNPQASLYGATSTCVRNFTNKLIYTTDLRDLRIDSDADVTVQAFIDTEVEGHPCSYLCTPKEVTVRKDGGIVTEVEVEFLDIIPKGHITVNYPTYETSVNGVTRMGTFSANFSVNVPVGQWVTQKFIHTLNTKNMTVQVYEDFVNGTYRQMIPAEVIIKDEHTVEVTFAQSIDGHVVFFAESEEPTLDSGVITNVSEVPYENPTYSKINSIGRQWIFRYALAICKEILGYIRGKYTTVPIPDSEATLNQQDLLTDARKEKDDLLKELGDMLDVASRQAQLDLKAKEAEALKNILTAVPVGIFIG